jgi:hypothetical protein
MPVAKRKAAEAEPALSELIADIVGDAEALLAQQVALFRSEVAREVHRVGDAAFELGAGAGLAATGGALGALAIVHGLRRATRLPLWSCYGLVGGVLGAAGVALLTSGAGRLSGVRLLPPPQTAEALQENLSWVKQQMR